MYVYIRSEPTLWTVGFYQPDGTWEPESDWDSPNGAGERARWLNGGTLADAQHQDEASEQRYDSAQASILVRVTEKTNTVDLALKAHGLTLHFDCGSWTAAEQLGEWLADATLTVVKKEAA